MMMGGSAADGAPQPGMGGMGMPGQQPGMGGQQGLQGLLAQIFGGMGKGGMKAPLFANGPLGQALGSQGIPMGVLGLLGQQLGK